VRRAYFRCASTPWSQARVGNITDSAFLSVGFSLAAKLPVNCSFKRARLNAFERGGNQRAYRAFIAY